MTEKITRFNQDLQEDVKTYLDEISRQRKEQAAHLQADLSEKTANRSRAVAETLAQFAQERQARQQVLREKLAAGKNNRAEQTAQNLYQLRLQREALSQQMHEDLTANKSDRASSVDTWLTDWHEARKANATNIKSHLKMERQGRVTEVQTMLEQFSRQRPNPQRQPKAPPPQPSVKPSATAATSPVVQITPTKMIDNKPIAANELISYLMEHTGKFTLEQLEGFFGANRLYNTWDDFLNLLEELRPGNKAELEALKQHKGGKSEPVLEKDLKQNELFALLVLKPDGLSIEELSQHFGISPIALTRQLKKLVDSGKALKKDKLYIAI